MSKVFMLMRYYADGSAHHQFKKYDEQIHAFRQIGYQVIWLSIYEDGIYMVGDCHKERILKRKANRHVSLLGRVIEYEFVYRAAEKAIQIVGKCDLAYVRSMPASGAFLRAMKAIRGGCNKVVMEIPTYSATGSEEKNGSRLWPKLMAAHSRRFQSRIAEYVDLFALIGDKGSSYYGKPAINISNGTSVSMYPAHKPRTPDGIIHILALANMAYWHGFDRLITGLAEYRKQGGERKIYIHLVGKDGDGSLRKWLLLARDLGISEHVVAEGPKFGAELDAMFQKCDIACTSLGLYRKKLDHGIDLKTAEYCSRGIPIIGLYYGTEHCEKIPYYLECANNDDSPIDIDAIIDFADAVAQATNVSEIIREYAEANMSWKSQLLAVTNKSAK